MADGPQLPSVIQKIRVQPYLSIRQFPNHQAWTSCLQNLPSAGGSSTGTFHVLFGVATAPIGRVKLMIQCRDEMIKSSRLPKPYKGIGNCFARTRDRKPHDPVISFGLHNYFLTLSNFKKDNDGYWKWLLGGLAVGTFADLATRVVVYPLDYAQTRLANDIKTNNKIEERVYIGIHVFFRPVLLLSLLWLQEDFLAATVMAVGVVVCQKMATYPLDTVNRRMMMTSGEVVKYQSSTHAVAEIIRNEGVKSLYKGGGACILETITLAAILTVFGRRMWNYFPTKKSNSAADSVSAKRNGSAGGGQSVSTLVIKWTYGKD
ncbi:hypothetical protein ACB098_05G089100 [Castanea mollissima]